jgi:ABC-2 type transport system ATP-binding protein
MHTFVPPPSDRPSALQGVLAPHETVLEVRNLVKQYPDTTAVNGVSFAVGAGQCFGLLGPNGAGKTTTVEIMEGLIQASSGEVLYRGRPLDGEFRQAAGIQFQATALQDYLTVQEHLRLFASFYTRTVPLNELAEACALDAFLGRDARKLSGGQRQRLLLAIALVNDPQVLFLDEPTTGLDPQARHNFWELLGRIREQGKTIVLTTHYMEEAYLLCDHVAIMDHGAIIASGPPRSLLAQHFQEVVLELPRKDFTTDGKDLPWTVLERASSVEILTENVNDAISWLMAAGVSLDGLKVRPRTLEDLFLELTGRELRP